MTKKNQPLKSSKHRNADLAERHRRKLEKQLGVPVRVIRRNAKGQPSKRGKTFHYYAAKPPKPPKAPKPKEPRYKGEMAIRTTYSRGKNQKTAQQHFLLTDVRILVRRKKTQAQIKQALSNHMLNDEPLPNWLSVRGFAWNHAPTTQEMTSGDYDDFMAMIEHGVPFTPDVMELVEPE